MDVRGKGVVVTGGGRGLGAALGHALAKRGAKVVLTARHEEEVERVVQAIRASGGVAHALVADIADKGAIAATAATAAELVGEVDLLVHNASTLGPVPMPLLLDTACEDLARVLEVNLVGPFRLTKAIAGAMLVRRRGLVVHLSSDAAVSAYPGWGAYGVSKAALDHLARSFAAEFEGTGVRFVTVDPGEMDTRMHADAIPDAHRSTLADPRVVAERIARLVEASDRLPSGARVEAAAWAVEASS